MKADLHIHTNFSPDGISSPQAIVNAAIEKGIQCICITDHGQIQGAVEALKFSFDKNILVIPGIEILSRAGDVLGINVKKIVPNGLSVKETVEEIKKQGGIAVIPHPFGWPAAASFWGSKNIICASNVHGVEAFNASVIFGFSNRRAFSFSQKNNLSFTAGSDAHLADFVGRGYIEIQDKVFSEKDVIEKIIAKQVEAKGTPLTIKELLRNSSKANLNNVARYYLVKIMRMFSQESKP